MKNAGLTLMFAGICLGCSAEPGPQIIPETAREVRLEVVENNVPGTVNRLWVEPMYDIVEVPAQLDPTGTYFRPSTKTIVEIRPGRFQRVEYPEDVEKSFEVGGSNE